MKVNVVDARGKACPEPVLLTKKALEIYKNGIDVLVDNVTARENIKRFAKNSGYNINIKEEQDGILLEIRK